MEAALSRIGTDFALWEAVRHVQRLEEFLARECDADEIGDQIALVQCVKWEAAMLTKVLAGKAFCYAGDEREFFDADSDLKGQYRAQYERDLKRMRSRRETLA